MSEVVFKKGLERNLPLSAAEGDIFFTKDTGRIFMGMGDGEPLLEMGGDGSSPGMIGFFGAAEPPKGWLKADGSEISRLDYPRLFQAIGTTFGEGDGETTFNLPDLRGEFIRGWDDERGVDSDREFGSYQEDELRSHNHIVRYQDSNAGTGDYDGAWDTSPTPNLERFLASDYTGGEETRPRNIALLACIRY